jgi:hypothetical protein
MMDRPGQRLLVGAALQGYTALAQHEHIDQWLQDHGPILKEFQKLNAFDHGIGPGAIGGINAMYAPAVWNLFAPQKFGQMKDGLNTLMQVFPLLREANSMLLGENVVQRNASRRDRRAAGGIGLWGVRNAVDDAANLVGQADVFSRHPALTYQGEQTQAYAYRNSLIAKLAPVLDYNYHNRGAEQTWTDAAFLPAAIRGQAINRATIDEIVHQKFPDFDPAAAQSMAVTKKSARDSLPGGFEEQRPEPGVGLSDVLRRGEEGHPDRCNVRRTTRSFTGNSRRMTDVFRQYATNLSEQDPRFLKYYNQFYVSRFGPIEQVTS